jgi:hypothetical protein
MIEFLRVWLFTLVHGGIGGRALSNAKYRPWFLGADDIATVAPADLARYRLAVVRKTRLNEIPLPIVRALGRGFGCVLENRRFVVLARDAGGRPSAFFDAAFARHAAEEDDRSDALFHAGAEVDDGSDATRAVVVSTYNRPQALARTLPQLRALGAPVLVVDDGSSPEARAENAAIAARCGAPYLSLPANRGLAAVVNVGISYWLADPAIAWISYFQDDVDVDPDLFAALEPLEDAVRSPVLTGFDTDEHATLRVERSGDREIKYKDNSTGMHLHCHRDYWAAVLPVPSRYLGAPKAGRGGSGADAWIVKRAPASAGARGLTVVCVPGLVTTFAWRREDSTWDNQHLLDRPARPASGS